MRLAAGTLYGALATLTERGWIVSLGDESEGRKKEYQITPAGREAVRAELRRLHELTQNGDALTSEWDTKRVWHLPYCFLEPGELEREFARLAAQGWLLEKCTYGTYTYRRGEPNEYEYRVQYIYESRDGQRTDYVKTLADMGVEKVGDMGSFLVLRKRADGAPFTLYSDLDAQIMDVRRLMRIKIILAVAFALLAADWFYNTWVWYDLAVSFDAMYADLRETYHQPSFLSLRLWGKHIVWYAVLGVLGTAAAVRTAMQAAHVGKTYGELKRKRLIEE